MVREVTKVALPDEPEVQAVEQFDMAKAAKVGLSVDWWAVILASALAVAVMLGVRVPW